MDLSGGAVTLFAFLLYANTFNGNFVYDDSRVVVHNPDVTGVLHKWGGSAWDVFRNDFWGMSMRSSSSHGSYRPLTILTFRLTTALVGGVRPYAFHAGNALLHALNTALLLALARRLLAAGPERPGARRCALVAAWLFSAHPVHCEAVASIAGRADLLATSFSLIGLLCFLRHIDWRRRADRIARRRPKDIKMSSCSDDLMWPPELSAKATSAVLLAVSLVLAVGGTLSKEPAFTIVGVFAVVELLIQRRRLRSHKHGQWSVSTTLGLTAMALFGVRMWVMGGQPPIFAAADNPIAYERSWITRSLSLLYLPVVNLRLLLLPTTLSFDWSMDAVPRITSVADPRNIFTVAFYAALYRVTRSAWNASGVLDSSDSDSDCSSSCGRSSPEYRRSPSRSVRKPPPKFVPSSAEVVLISLSIMVLPFLPASNLFFYVGFVVAERVLYLPSVGFCLLVALGGLRIFGDERKRRRCLVGACLVILLVSMSAKTLSRNKDWRSEEDLYRSGISINPPKAYGNLGSVLSSAGRYDEAEQAFKQALLHRPNMAEVHYNLGSLYLKRGLYPSAIRYFKTAIRFRPSLAIAYLNLGYVLALEGREDEATEVLHQCVRLRVDGVRDPEAHRRAQMEAQFRLGDLLYSRGDLHDALRALHDGIAAVPQGQRAPSEVYRLVAEITARLKTTQATHETLETEVSEAKETTLPFPGRKCSQPESIVTTAAHIKNASQCSRSSNYVGHKC